MNPKQLEKVIEEVRKHRADTELHQLVLRTKQRKDNERSIRDVEHLSGSRILDGGEDEGLHLDRP